MKKTLSLFLAVIMLLGAVSFSAFAEEEDKYAPEKYSDEESAAGFSFKYIYVVIKNEYSFQEFTPEMFSAELVSRVEAPYSFNPDNTSYDKDSWELLLKVYLKEQTKENVIALYCAMKECEYVEDTEVSYIYTYFPIYPDSPEEIGYYSGQYRPFVSPENESYVAAGKTMIRNPYYSVYYDELLAHSVSVYNQFADYMGDVDYVSYFFDNYLKDEKNYVTLIFDAPEEGLDEETTVREYNSIILELNFTEDFHRDDILYIGNTVFAAVVCIDKDNMEAIRGIEELAFIGDAFFTQSSGVQLCVTGQYNLGNVHGEKDVMSVDTEKITAADARYILRYAAGLEKIEKEPKRFFYCADMNFDGVITSADARLALRTAAGLEPTYEILFGYSSMWYDPMGNDTQWW